MDKIITKLRQTPQPKSNLRVAAYARVSCEKDAMLHSLAAQVSYYRRLIQSRQDWEYAGIYADEAETGTKDSRPEFQRLLADCRAGRIDLVLTKSVSRFARNTVTLLETVRELKALGIGVFFEEQQLHSLSGNGELLLTILASYAQEESRSVSENCKWRIRGEFKEGRPTNKFSIYGYEYKEGKLSIVPEEAAVVRMIFVDYLTGLGKNAIMKKLTERGVPTKLGGRWSESTISAMLKNEKYTGDTCLQKCFTANHITKLQRRNNGELPKYYVEETHEAIIDRETFNAVQMEIMRRASIVKCTAPQVKGTYDFSGMIRCGRCGATFTRKINGAGKYAKATWACRTFTYKGKAACPAKRIPEEILREKCAQVLGLAEYDSEKFKARVESITVPADGLLVFEFKDHTSTEVAWKNRPPRPQVWSDEMRAAARERLERRRANGND